MDTISLWKYSLKDKVLKKNFGGVFASDQLPRRKNKNKSFIVNLDPHHKPGSHWIAINFKNNVCYYFCSYGTPPANKNILSFIKRNSKSVEWSTSLYQSFTSQTCGKFCLYFLHRITRSKKLDLIPNHVMHNECVVKTFFEKLSESPDLHQVASKCNQGCKSYLC